MIQQFDFNVVAQVDVSHCSLMIVNVVNVVNAIPAEKSIEKPRKNPHNVSLNSCSRILGVIRFQRDSQNFLVDESMVVKKGYMKTSIVVRTTTNRGNMIMESASKQCMAVRG